MADFKRIVEILVQVTGDTGRQIEAVASNLKKIESAVSTLSSSATAAVGNINKMVDALGKVKDFQVPQLDQFAKDIKKLSEVDSGKLTSIAVSLDTLSKVKFNNSIGTMFTKIGELSKIGDPGKVAALADALARFGGVGKLPSLTSFVNNLKELSTVTKIPSLQGLANQLVSLSSITQLPAIGSFVNNLGKLNAIGTVPDLSGLAKALNSFQNVKSLPDLTSFANGLSAISSIAKPASFAALATSLKRLETIDVSKMPKAPELLLLSNAIKSFSNIGTIPSITKFVNALQKLQDIGKVNVPNFGQLVSEVNRLSAAFQNMANVAPIVTALAAMGIQAGKLQQQLNQVTNVTAKTAQGFDAFLGKVKTYIGYRIIADNIIYLKEAILSGQDAIIDFDQSLKDLQAISGATDVEVLGMAETIKMVAATTKFSAAEVAEGMIILAQAGFSAVEASRAMEAVANLATGTLESMAQTVDLISTAMSIFGIEASRATEVADMLANAINKSKLTVEKLRTAINYVGPVAEDAGISMGEMSAAMMTLANSGLRASTIGTSLRTVIGELIDPSTKLETAARKAGVSLTELDPRVNSLSSVIQKLRLVVTDSQDALDIFGKRASSAVLTLANTTVNGYDDMLEAVGKSGTAAAMAAKQMEGLGVAFKNLRDKLSLLAVEMGDGGIVQAFRLFVNAARAVVDALIAISSTGMGKFVGQVAVASSAIVGMIFVFSKMGGAITFVRSGLVSVATTLGVVSASSGIATTSVIALRTALRSIGIGLAISAVATAIDFFTNKAQAAADETGVLILKLESLAASVNSYSNKVADSGDDVGKTTEANKQLRTELEEVAKNSEEFGSVLANAALEAMQGIDALNFSVGTEGVAAIENYKKTIDSIKNSKLSDHFKQQEEAIKESVSFTTRAANRINKALAGLGSAGFGIAETDIFEDVSKQEERTLKLSEARRNHDAQQFIDMLMDKKLAWSEYVDHIKKISENIDKTAAEDKAIEVYNKYVEMSGQALLRLKEQGKDVSNSTVEELMKIAESLGFVQAEGTASFGALEAKLSDLALKSTTTSKGILDNWRKDGLDIGSSMNASIKGIGDTSKEVAAGIAAVLGSIDMSVLDKIAAERAAILKKSDALEALYLNGKIEKDKQYYIEKSKLEKEAAALSSTFRDQESAFKAEAFERANKQYAKDLEKTNRIYANNTNARLQEEARLELEYLDKINRIKKGIAANPEDLENQLKNKQAAMDAAGSVELQAIAELEAEKKITEEEAAKLRVQSEFDALSQKATMSAAYFESIKDLVAQDSDAWKKANTAKLGDEKALADFIRKDLVDALNKASKAQEHLKELYGSNKMGGKVGAEVDKHGTEVGKDYKDYRNKVEDIHYKSGEKIKDIEEKLVDKLKKINEDRVKDVREAEDDILGIHRKGADQIRAINQRGMNDRKKEADNKKIINEKMNAADNMLSKARLNNDASALKSAESLYGEVFSMAGDLKSKTDAIYNTNRSTKGLVDSREVKAAIDELERGKKTQEAMLDAEKAISKETADAARDSKEVTGKYAQLASDETARHEKEMANLKTEIDEWTKKLNLAQQTATVLQQSSAGSALNRPGVDAAKSKIVIPDAKSGTPATTDLSGVSNQYDKLKKAVEAGMQVKIDGSGAITIIEDVKRAVPGELKTTATIDTTAAQNAAAGLKQSVEAVPAKRETELYIDSTGAVSNLVTYKTLVDGVPKTMQMDVKVENKESAKKLEDTKTDLTAIYAALDKAKDMKLSVDMTDEDKAKAAQLLADLKAIQEKKDQQISVDVQGEEKVGSLKNLIDSLVDKTVRVIAEVSGIERLGSLKAMIDSIQSKTVTITTNYVSNGSPVQKFAGGIIEKFAGGGTVFKRLSSRLITNGSGTKDDVPAMLMKDEFVHKQAAVKKYGVGFMNMINNLQFPLDIARQFQSGGLVSTTAESIVQKFAKGGSVLGLAKKRIEDMFGIGSVNLNLGSVSVNNIEKTADSMSTDIGANAVQKMANSFESMAGAFAEGGSASSVLSAADIEAIEKSYAEQIAVATKNGRNDIVQILKRERDDVLNLSKSLDSALENLQAEYQRKTELKEMVARGEISEEDASYQEEQEANASAYKKQVDEDNSSFAKEDLDYMISKDTLRSNFEESTKSLQKELVAAEDEYQKELKSKLQVLEDLRSQDKNYRSKLSTFWAYPAGSAKLMSGSIIDILREHNRFSMSREGRLIHLGPIDEDTAQRGASKYYEKIGTPLREAESEYNSYSRNNPKTDILTKIKEEKTAYETSLKEAELERANSVIERALAVAERDKSYATQVAESEYNYKSAKNTEQISAQKEVDAYTKEYTAKASDISGYYSSRLSGVHASAIKDISSVRSRMESNLETTQKVNTDDSSTYTQAGSGLPIDELLKRLGKGILKFNTGGLVPFIKGAIQGKDSILAALTPKEYVMNAAAVSTFGSGFFDQLNNLQIPRFNMGGLVDSTGIDSPISKVVHALDLSFNGQNLGELTGNPVTIENFISTLEMARMRT